MKKVLILSLLTLTFANCKNNTPKVSKVNEEGKTIATEKPSSLLQTGCYSYNANNNAINLEITSIEKGVTGKLTYALDGKDSNSGTFVGKLEDNKLFGVYTFTSEGVESRREVAFLVKVNQLIEGYGELTESGDAFKNKNNINFTSTLPLTKTDCDRGRVACLFVNGKTYSYLQQTCLEIATLNIKINPLKNGAMTKGSPAFLLFDDTKSRAELFMPKANEGLVMSKISEGNWSNGDYTLIAWKGYVVQYKGTPIFGGN